MDSERKAVSCPPAWQNDSEQRKIPFENQPPIKKTEIAISLQLSK